MKILFVSPYVPSPIRVRPYNFLRALARRGHQITLVCSMGRRDEAALADLRPLCAKVVTLPLSAPRMLANALRALPGELPLQAALNFDPRLIKALRQEARAGHDVAHIEHLRGSALAYGLLGVPVLLDSVDCISLLFERALRGSPSLKSRLMAFADLARTRAYEAHYPDRYDRVIVSSPEDAWALDQLHRSYAARSGERRRQGTADSEPIVIPNGVDLDYFAPQDVSREPATVVFSGKMGYHANDAAALFLVQEIMPLVWTQRPETRVVIAGGFPPQHVRQLANDSRVEVTGYLPDLRPAIARATLAVCPLRYGVGIQNKVLEAMALATPVVAARKAARALAATDGHDLLLASEGHEYARAILQLMADPRQAGLIGAAGRRYVERYHDWGAAAARLEGIYREMVGLTNGRLEHSNRLASPFVN